MNTTALLPAMRAALIQAQEERPKRQDFIDGELGWVIFERTTMLNAVNSARAEQGLDPVAIADIERVEQQAVGHCDYTQKFALYCAELAQERP